MMRSPRTGRGNRLGLGLIGLTLTAGGLFCIGQTRSAWFSNSRSDPLLTGTETTWTHHHRPVWILAAVIAALVALLCLRWLVVQARTARLRVLRLEPHPVTGQTTLETRALSDAIASEIGHAPHVEDAQAELTGPRERPELRLTITLNDPTLIGALRQQLVDEILPHACQALETPQLATYIILNIGK